MTRLNIAVLLQCLLFTGSLIGISATAHAPTTPDWEDCHDELDRTRRGASDATDAAEEVQSALEDYEKCRRYPESYDLLNDGCAKRRRDYESATSELESKMDDLDSRLRSVQDSCGYDFTINRLSALDASRSKFKATEVRLCTSYKQFLKLGLTPQQVLQYCSKERPAEWCRTCLGTK